MTKTRTLKSRNQGEGWSEIKPMYLTGNRDVAIVKNNMPIGYRLTKQNGDYVLQGQFHYHKGFNKSWTEWENLPTLEISDE